MRSYLSFSLKYWSPTLLTGVALSNCHQQLAQTVVPVGPTVVVHGRVYGTRDTLSLPLRNFSVEFSRRLPDQTIERTSDERMPATGRYTVRLAAGQLYQARLTYGSCEVELQEFATPLASIASAEKNFYLSYTDTVSFDHSTCLAGRKRY